MLSINALLRRWWLIVALVMLAVVVTEIAEHQTDMLTPGFLWEVLVFGAAIPAGAGLAIAALTRATAKPPSPSLNQSAAKSAPPRRVLIVDNNLLLGAGVETILRSAADMLVQGDNPPTKAALFQTISSINPQVIVFDEATPRIEAADMLALLKTYPKLQLVVLSADNDWVKIYSKQQILLDRVSDLAEIIRYNLNAPLAQPGRKDKETRWRLNHY